MRHRWLSYLIILLLTLQSAMAMSDARLSLTNKYPNNDLNNSLSCQLAQPSTQSTTIENIVLLGDGCLDCNHCSCCLNLYSQPTDSNSFFDGAGQLIIYAPPSLDIVHLSSLLRPPIA